MSVHNLVRRRVLSQCRRAIRQHGAAASADDFATLCCTLATLTAEAAFDTDGSPVGPDDASRRARQAAACAAAGDILTRARALLEARHDPAAGTRPAVAVLPVFVTNTLEAARTAVAVYHTMATYGRDDGDNAAATAAAARAQALRLAWRLVRLSADPTATPAASAGEAADAAAGPSEVPAVVSEPSHAHAWLLLARVLAGHDGEKQGGLGAGAGAGTGAARQVLGSLERAARAGGLLRVAHEAAALGAALGTPAPSPAASDDAATTSGGSGSSSGNAALSEQLRLLAAARRLHLPTVEAALCRTAGASVDCSPHTP